MVQRPEDDLRPRLSYSAPLPERVSGLLNVYIGSDTAASESTGRSCRSDRAGIVVKGG